MSSIRQVGSKLIRATVPAQNANMQGLGAQLGQHGFKVIDFCKQFNDQTKTYAKDTPLTTMITLNKDRSFSFIVKPPKTAHLIKMAAQVCLRPSGCLLFTATLRDVERFSTKIASTLQ
eukprot:TRINITY_DN654_c0_g1_i5.p1 TRINITY_DN654_c0_g1~~TRINITY_DN654_c0_g1_i5.p1  ORF type:complete len:131 (-),score=4.85 TRINITY_DN654_c0_g1_i5:141-494(-)